MLRALVAAIALSSCAPSRTAIVLETTRGPIHCELDRAHAPRATAMIVGLANGATAWRDPHTSKLVSAPYYDDVAFFRAIPSVLVQTGCRLGNGSGTPGFRLPVETTDDDLVRLSTPGALFLAHYTPPPDRVDPSPPRDGLVIGAQLVVALTDMSHLAGRVTVAGVCRDLDVVARIAVDVSANVPVRLVRLREHAIERKSR